VLAQLAPPDCVERLQRRIQLEHTPLLSRDLTLELMDGRCGWIPLLTQRGQPVAQRTG
jgi:hypothetical protein